MHLTFGSGLPPETATLSLWIFGLLFISLPGTYGLTSFPDNVVAAKRDDPSPVTLTCGVTSDGTTTWKFEKDGDIDDVDLVDGFQQEGCDLKVSYVDAPMVGEYSCWAGERKLSSTHLLLDAEEDETDSPISCWATSYNCKFSCKWTHSEYTAVRLGLGHDCSEGRKSCPWVNSSDQVPDGRFQFELSHSLSPYAEESNTLEVTAEAINDYSFLRTTKRFYLRDIVKPERPKKVTCLEDGQDLNVTIEPASSWSTPHSYFSLEHEIEYVYKDNGKKERSTSPLIPKGISKLRVRSRDSLVLSPWSQWTAWRNVTY
ncbi:interleukin-12 subunit beta [Polymixia lowei]